MSELQDLKVKAIKALYCKIDLEELLKQAREEAENQQGRRPFDLDFLGKE